MTVNDLLYVIYAQQHIVIYERTNAKYNLYDGIAYNVDSYDPLRRKQVYYVYTVESEKESVLMIEVR